MPRKDQPPVIQHFHHGKHTYHKNYPEGRNASVAKALYILLNALQSRFLKTPTPYMI